MKLKGFVIGQTVYLRTRSVGIEPWGKEKILEATVVKVGRRYITVKRGETEYAFDSQNNFMEKTDFSPQYVLYISKQDIYDYWNAEYLLSRIKRWTNTVGTSKDALRILLEVAKVLSVEPMQFKRESV